jgi:hypothetical protein
VAAALLVSGLLTFQALPAQAAAGVWYQDGNYVKSKFTSYGDYFNVCDTDGDSEEVYIKWKTNYGRTGQVRLVGRDAHCEQRNYDFAEGNTISWIGCVDLLFRLDLCGDWHRATI